MAGMWFSAFCPSIPHTVVKQCTPEPSRTYSGSRPAAPRSNKTTASKQLLLQELGLAQAEFQRLKAKALQQMQAGAGKSLQTCCCLATP